MLTCSSSTMVDSLLDDDDSTASYISSSSQEEQKEQEEEQARSIHLARLNTLVSWTDTDGQKQSLGGLTLDVHVDFSPQDKTNTAFFRLRGSVFLRHRRCATNKQSVYLFIYPEELDTVTLERNNNHGAAHVAQTTLKEPNPQSLCFSMKRPPALVVPKGVPLASKPATQELLDAIQALARATCFTVYFNRGALPHEDLALLTRVFSSSSTHNRPATDTERARLAPLYTGYGGQIIDVSGISSREENAAADCKKGADGVEGCSAEVGPTPPPAYGQLESSCNQQASTSGVGIKRRRIETSPTASDRKAMPPSPSSPILLKNILSQLIHMSARIEALHTRVEQMDKRVDIIAYAIDRDPVYRLASEDRQELFESVDARVEDALLAERITMQNQIDEDVQEVGERIGKQVTESLRRARLTVDIGEINFDSV
ncbi:uncharacterized protein BCR38DRAFT_165822 [Pseudomassariella vexata]|uniref:Uncharacterized protein n=1 Tax=Pseudomassariella vexata TaxID=1141098 RepID=A0A1Y2E2J9_9PEZI|nr:uncharacterized protein BCR38DRAFT_165822 [Pseudomassariella vexata]ORY65778.1 hypothetical protein BCR38DRAFT_165822 [Pseudomassariella vexata]